VVGRDVDAEVDHAEAVGVEQGDDDVLADVVDVTAHRGDDHLAATGPLPHRGHAGDEQLGRLADDLAGHDEGGDVVRAVLVEAAHALHAGAALLDEHSRVLAGIQTLADLRQRAALVHAHDEFVEVLADGAAHGVRLLPWGRRCRPSW
jgi:hypothetical protein